MKQLTTGRVALLAILSLLPFMLVAAAREGRGEGGGNRSFPRTPCASCHETTKGKVAPPKHFLNARVKLSEPAWRGKAKVQGRCGICHATPTPDMLSQEGWGEAIGHMGEIMTMRKMVDFSHEEWMDLIHYYFTFSRDTMQALAADPARSPIAFSSRAIGFASDRDSPARIGNLRITDLDRDGAADILVCDDVSPALSWIHRSGTDWREDTLAPLPYPGHAEPVDIDGDGVMEIVVACLGSLTPTDSLFGGVALLKGSPSGGYIPQRIATGLGRTADARPGDFDRDGDIDFSVAIYGHINTGGLAWLENRGGEYTLHQLTNRAGVIHAPVVDLDGDGNLDIVAVTAQEHEQVTAHLGDGRGKFREVMIFKAVTPSYGSSGIEVADLDADGDLDILYTNGDNMDLPTMFARPYQGVQILENLGGMKFKTHDVLRYYGAYRALPADLDGDHDPDIVVVSMFNDWSDTTRASAIWLENKGKWKFEPRGIATAPTHLITADVGDIDGDGRVDIVAGGMHVFPPFERLGRVTFWRNMGYSGEPWVR